MKTATVLVVSMLLAGGSAHASEVLQVVERATTDAVTDTGASGDSAGDILTFANEIFDAANQARVGTNQGFCVRTAVGKSWECWWTLMMPEGQITVQGPFLDKGDSMLAITGGTGKYAAARGQMKLHARNDKGTEYDFTYEVQ